MFLLCIFLASLSFSEIRRSNQAASSITRNSTKTFENPYITDGLIAMWDGEWNVGIGIHNDKANVWNELISGYDAILTSHGAFGENYLECDGIGYSALIPYYPSSEEIVTIQYVFSETTKKGIMAMFGLYRYAFDQYNINQFGCSWNSPCYVNIGNPSGVNSMTIVYDVELNSVDNAYKGTQNIIVGTSGNTPKPNQDYGSIGGRFGMDTSSVARAFKLHSIRIYNRSLSEEEIAHNYEVDKWRFGL